MKAFVKGDFEGFFTLGVDNMVVLLLMSTLCLGVLGFSDELFFYRILPATAVGLIIGNLFYSYQAHKLAKKENRDDVCALPYGTSILTVIVFGFLIMFPTQQKALADGLSKDEADLIAWYAGIIACYGSGLIEFFGSFFVQRIQRVTPRAALLVAIGGIGLAFMSMGFVFRTYTYPLIGFPTLALVFVFFFAGMKNKLRIPGGLLVILTGTAISWGLYAFGLPTVVPVGELNTAIIGLNLPIPVVSELRSAFKYLYEFLPIILPMGFIFLIGSIQNIESAAASGDNYKARPAMLVSGAGTLAAAFFGSPFPTSIYLGHPGYKKMGSRAGYSTLNGVVWSLVSFTGTLSLITYVIPIEAGMAVLVWLGIVMCSLCFQATARRHAPAVVLGLIPALAAYVATAVKHALSVSGEIASTNFFFPAINTSFATTRSFYTDGMFAVSQGYLFTSMVLTAALVHIIDRQFNRAAVWFFIGAALSLIGITNTYTFIAGDVIGELSLPLPVWNRWTSGYVLMAMIMLITPYITVSDDQPRDDEFGSDEL
jgi:adenine/guanine/hypoxanthine permease